MLRRLFIRPDYSGSTTGNLARRSSLALITRLAPGVTTVLLNIAIGRLAGSSTLGLTQSITSSASIAALAYPTLAGRAASRYVASSSTQGEAKVIASFLAKRTLIISILATIVVGGITLFGRELEFSTAAVAMLMVLGLSGRTFIEGLHFGGGEGTRLAKWSLIVAMLSLTISLLLLVCGVRSAWVIAPLAALNVGFTIISWPRRAAPLGDKTLRRELLVFTALSLVGMLASSGFANATVLVAGALNGLSYAGEYAAAFALTTPITLFAAAISSVLFSALAAAHQSESLEGLRERLRSTTALMSTIIVAMLIVVMFSAKWLVLLLWGEEFSLTPLIIMFLLPVAAISAIAVPAVTSITSSSNHGMAVSAASSLAGALCGVSTWGVFNQVSPIVGVPLGFSVGTVISAGIPFIFAWKKFQMRWMPESISDLGFIGITFLLALWAQAENLPVHLTLGIGLTLLSLWSLLRFKDLTTLFSLLKSFCMRSSE